MKRKITSFFCITLFSVTASFAQFQYSDVTPNFTHTDTDGVTHTLYDYLDAGKSVYISIFATWCGACWSYEQTGALNNLYATYGPNGSDDIMIFGVEYDPSTGASQLNGVGGNTQGNWNAAINYPILDSYTISTYFDFPGTPALFVVCPDRRHMQIAASTNQSYLIQQGNNCPSATEPVDARNLGFTGGAIFCSDDFVGQIGLMNTGTDILTNATIEVSQGGNVLGTTNWSGNLSTYSYEVVNLDPIPGAALVEGNVIFNVIATNDNNASNNLKSKMLSRAVETDNQIEIEITTDYWSSEVHWRILNSSGVTVPGTINPALGSNTTTQHSYTLTPGCYTFVITDDYGDGIINGNTQTQGIQNGSLWVGDSDGTTIFNQINYGLGTEVSFEVTGYATIEETEQYFTSSIYPNPSTGAVNFTVNSDLVGEIYLRVVDLMGKIVYTENITSSENGEVTLDLNHLQNGQYIIQISNEGMTSSKKFDILK